MKQRLIGALVLAGVVALGLGAKKAYVAVEIQGCNKAVLYNLKQRYGEIPAELKDDVLSQVDAECRQAF